MTPAQQWIADRSVVEHRTGCWRWVSSMYKQGYGKTDFLGRTRQAHRLSYEAFKGPIPAGLTIDHLCRCRRCVNPDHLEAVTIKVNTLRSPIAPAAINSRKTHCSRGHAFTAENVYMHQGRRHCRSCSKIRRDAWISLNLERAREYSARWHRERRQELARLGVRRAENPPVTPQQEEQ